MLGYATGVAGAAVAAAMGRVQNTNLENSHRAIGLTVFILLTLQVAAALFWRPAPLATKVRRVSWACGALHPKVPYEMLNVGTRLIYFWHLAILCWRVS